MVSQERMRPTTGALPQERILSSSRRHLDLRHTSLAVGPFSQVREVMNHARTILVLFIMTFRHDLIKQFLSAHFRRWEGIILSQETNVIANPTFVTISGVVKQDGAIFVPQAAALVLFNKPS